MIRTSDAPTNEEELIHIICGDRAIRSEDNFRIFSLQNPQPIVTNLVANWMKPSDVPTLVR